MGTGALDPREVAGEASPAAGVTLVDLSCRILDVVVATVALVVTAPLLLLVAAIIKLDSPGPALFNQRRLGLRQDPFTLHKFRTMSVGVSHDRHREYVQGLLAGERPPTPAGGGPLFKLSGDPRITRVGRFLRRSSLDELPQLWNVIRGNMSLVGPRPPISYEVDHYPSRRWLRRFEVKPGMTGLWQVSGRCDLTLHQMIELDIEYVTRRSLRLNLLILLRTLPAVINSRGAS